MAPTSSTTAVTLTSLERSNPALFQRMVIGTSNWVVDGLAFETPPAVENRGMVFVSDGADDVTIKNSTFMVRQSGDSSHWTKEEWQSLTGSVRLLVGINTAGKDTIIENNYIKNIQYAITAAEESSGAIIRRNTVDGFTIERGGMLLCLRVDSR